MNQPNPNPLSAADDPNRPAHISVEDWQKHLDRNRIIEIANAEPLPGPLLAAFSEQEISAAGITLRPFVAGDVPILRQLNSPLFRRMMALGSSEKSAEAAPVAFEDAEGYEMIYQFAIPISEVRSQLRLGREHFREQAMQAIADKINPMATPHLVEMVVKNLINAFSTVLHYQSKKTEAGDGSTFIQPPAERQTGSAGGSTMSAQPCAPRGAA